MKKLKFFSMIEILVGIVVLTIMMAFLINAFTTAERIASTGSKGMTVFEKSSMALDFVSGEIRQLSCSSKNKLDYVYTPTSIDFKARLPFSSTPTALQRIVYTYSSETLTRQLFTYDPATLDWTTPVTTDPEVLMTDIAEFNLEMHDANGVAMPSTSTDYPSYTQIEFKLKELNNGKENIQRAFSRRIDFQN